MADTLAQQRETTDPGETVAADAGFVAQFWGVRGSIACPGSEYLRYGGNTSCVQVQVDGRHVIFDCGTGLRRLGDQLAGNGRVEADVFLTHTHVDHIQGLPFFKPLFMRKNRFRVWAGHLVPYMKLRDVLCKYMADPLFPVPPDIFAAEVEYNDFVVGETLELTPDTAIRTAPLNHPQGATGYRVDHGGRSLCYITDTEHVEGQSDQRIVRLVSGADIMIYDCTYSDEEYPRYRGWGHSTWQEALRVADQAQVERVVIFHHDPSHDDDAMDRVAEAAERMRPGTLVAREGLELRLL